MAQTRKKMGYETTTLPAKGWEALVCSAHYQQAMVQRTQRFFQLMPQVPCVLTNSNTEALHLYELLDNSQAIDKLLSLKLDYTMPEGEIELRQAISRLYQTLKAEHILVETGAQEGIHHFILACLQPGDHVIVQFPCYPPILELLTARGCRISFWSPEQALPWRWNLGRLNRRIRKDTRALFINNPHNPTGYLMSHTMLYRLNRLAQEHKIIVFSDEVYRFLEYDPRDRLPAMVDINNQAVSLGTLSKAFSVPGLRLGWIATRNPLILEKLMPMKDRTTICTSRLSQLMGCMVLEQKDRVLQRNHMLIAQNLAMLTHFFQQFHTLFQWDCPKAGTILFPRLKIAIPVEPFCYQLACETGVMFWPGNFFYYGDHHFRIGYGHRHLAEGLQRLERYFYQLSNRYSGV